MNTIQENNVRQHDKTCILTLNNLTKKDSGMYYCISHHNQMAVIGNGSRVIVTGIGLNLEWNLITLFLGSKLLKQATFWLAVLCYSSFWTKTIHLIHTTRNWLVIRVWSAVSRDWTCPVSGACVLEDWREGACWMDRDCLDRRHWFSHRIHTSTSLCSCRGVEWSRWHSVLCWIWWQEHLQNSDAKRCVNAESLREQENGQVYDWYCPFSSFLHCKNMNPLKRST